MNQDLPLSHIETLLEEIRDLLIWVNRDETPRQYHERLAELVAEHKAMKKESKK